MEALTSRKPSAHEGSWPPKAERHNEKLRTTGKSPHTHFGYGR
jgi:hypothetical protein